ncbi:D-alanyl-D-alanine carboxypeptidase [Caldalkalibacillus uzonensis]|uniref:D-alanyl-D-alanine carboxypeptidase n=1 Tax=Caldalkalibacillus uzonensis TaxID=353224 RepID=A0ABU0CUI1_9BACI|nr:D-alanyl-D-alanine carboxypeptidase [Caldalkalibacillus uzonensis]
MIQRQIMIVLVMILSVLLAPYPAGAEPDVSAQAAILMDAESGRVLFEKNAYEPLRIASITKIMTAIVALEHGDLEDVVTTSKNAYGVEGSSIYLRLGEKMTLEDLLYGLMLRSGNDAAIAIAEHVGGSVEGFVFLMNQKAEELGMQQTLFSNPHGLDTHEEHYSTAYDMALLTAYAMQNETFAEIVSTQKKTAPLEGEKWDRVWYNKNRLLSMYPYADGVKTGYTQRANRTLVSSATKDGHRLIAVTLNAPDDWNDHINMFEYGFQNYTLVTLAEEGETLRDERFERTDGHFKYLNDFRYPLREDEHLQKQIVIDPAFKQEELETIPNPAGYIHYILDNEQIGRTPVGFFSVEQDVSVWQRFRSIFDNLLGVGHG